MAEPLYLGIDLGTSGCRAIAIDDNGAVLAEAYTDLPPPKRDGVAVEQEPALWWQALEQTLANLAQGLDLHRVAALAIDGTSSTLLLTDAKGRPLAPALMYNDARAVAAARAMAHHAPRETAASGPQATLAKLLWWQGQGLPAGTAHALAPADWLCGRLTGVYGVSDANNSIKLGYDPLSKAWPRWLDATGVERRLLPRVLDPGTPLGPLDPAMAQHLGLAPDTQVVAGTTDSTAAIYASGARDPGEAVTSLGSTLVPKVITTAPIYDPRHGVYSQPYGSRWLVGGGSNSGGAVLLKYFSQEQLTEMTPHLRPDEPTGLDYYPLTAPGERFPVADPQLAPRLEPRPVDDLTFFQGMLEGMARIERQAYDLLAQLGAPYPGRVYSLGGGARNPAWTRIRARCLGVPVVQALHHQAAYGTALLARRGAGA